MSFTRIRFFIVAFFCPLFLSGQHLPLDQMYYEHQLSLSQQYAHPYLLDSVTPSFFKGELRYLSREGVRAQPFGERTLNTASFGSYSSLHISGWDVLGKFNYEKLLEAQVPYLLQSNALGWVPYRLLDEEEGSWSGDGVNFQVAAQSPHYGVSDRFNSFGMISYEVSSTTRSAEPRPLARYSQYRVLLGQRMRLGQALKTGIGAGISSGSEENEIGNYAVQDVRIQQGRGWGTFTSNTFRSFQRNQFFQQMLVFGFLQVQQNNVSAFVEAKALTDRFDARDGIAFPQDGGKAKANNMEITSGATYRPNPKTKLETSVKYLSTRIMAVDPVFSAINFEGTSSRWQWETVFYRGNWQLGASAQHHFQVTADIAAEELLQTNVLQVSAYMLTDVKLGEKSRLFLRPAANVQHGRVTTQYKELSALSRRLLLPIEDFYSRPYIEPNLGASWSTLLARNHVFSVGFSFSKRISNAYPLTEFAIHTSLLL